MSETAKKYGRLTAQQASALGYLPAKVFLDGVEVARCTELDDIQGWVALQETDSKGDIVMTITDWGPIAMQYYLFGAVRYEPNPHRDRRRNGG